ncbi:MAG: TIM barrel protein [Anaerolineaceae bacterium]|nr:TIM barrel protein [Anaerolineaceae bacterium]
MIHPGLVSITFRALKPPEIINLVVAAELGAIEWGADRHVLPGDLAAAREVRRQMDDAGLKTCSYGSYYRLGSAQSNPDFSAIIDSALALHAPLIRVWAGTRGSAETPPAERDAVLRDARRICDLAVSERLEIAVEYHPNTLTDTAASAVNLLEQVNHPALRSYWQPTTEALTQAEKTESLRAVLPWLSHLHVFTWSDQPTVERFPLKDGAARWLEWLNIAARDSTDHHALIEFVRSDQPESFLRDAAVLKTWLEQIQNSTSASIKKIGTTNPAPHNI